MSSILEKARALTGAITSKPAVTSAQLAVRVRAANHHIASLEARHAEVSLAWASGATGGNELDKLEGDLAAARRELRALQAALALADQNEGAAQRERTAAIHEKQLRAATSHLRARTRAASELATAIEQAAIAFKRVVESSEKARAACPIGSPWPMGSLCSFGEVRKLVQIELYRHGGDPSLSHARSFPGAEPSDFIKAGDPGSQRPLVETLTAADEHVIGILKNRVPADTPPPVYVADQSAPKGEHVEEGALSEPPPSVDERDLQPFVPPNLPPIKLSLTD